ncbi:hypothetical protein [Pseudoduganella namucuonensis]|uniref:Uncharacterized protein n=1 Tax=Pseudoduganella namucuonensis TaxID=1035707 RepID=A0A1I7FL18_9BURK|nr:hypothetical protein [Pseudoduganella namucuonensis]SFU36845.1 hypothetical protein SAMN05216552_1002118 [Pseudoduganella namucuonensis]
MKTAAPPIFPASTTSAAKVMLACLGVYWACMLTFSFGETRNADVAIKVLLGVACCLLALTVSLHAQALGHAVRILNAQRAPVALWRTWLRAWLLTATRYWAVICAGVSLQLTMPASTTFWLAGPALLSLALCLTALRTLGRLGMAPRGWGHAAEMAALCIVLYAGMVSGFGAALAWFAGLPVPLLLAFAATWPAMAWTVSRRWETRLPVRGVVARRSAIQHGSRVTTFFKRHTVLHWGGVSPASYPHQRTFPGKMLLWFNGEIMFWVIMLQMQTAQWNDTVVPLRAIGMFMLAMATASKLVVRDLHWRTLLLPGGLRRERIGTHIVLSTLTFQIMLMLAVAVIYLSVVIPTGTPATVALSRVLSMACLPFELALITSAAAVLRVLSSRALMALIAVAVAAGLGALYFIFFGGPAAFAAQIGLRSIPLFDALSWRIGPAYLLLLAAATVLFTHIANRLWTPEKLLRQMPKKGSA